MAQRNAPGIFNILEEPLQYNLKLTHSSTYQLKQESHGKLVKWLALYWAHPLWQAYFGPGLKLELLCITQEWQDDEDVVYCRPLVEAGEKVTAIEDGMPTWIYEVLVTKPSIEGAIQFVKGIEAAIEPSIPIVAGSCNLTQESVSNKG